MTYLVQIEGRRYAIQVAARADRPALTIDGEPLEAEVCFVGAHTVSLVVAGVSYTFHVERDPEAADQVRISRAGTALVARVTDPRRRQRGAAAALEGRLRLTAPMAGRVVRCLAAPGDLVAHGQGLLVLEAMKMQNEVRAPKAGRLITLAVAAGAAVASGDLLAEIE